MTLATPSATGEVSTLGVTARGYPAEALDKIHVGVVSDEDVQRTTGGNYWYYFK
jgi:hypothetical protein